MSGNALFPETRRVQPRGLQPAAALASAAADEHRFWLQKRNGAEEVHSARKKTDGAEFSAAQVAAAVAAEANQERLLEEKCLPTNAETSSEIPRALRAASRHSCQKLGIRRSRKEAAQNGDAGSAAASAELQAESEKRPAEAVECSTKIEEPTGPAGPWTVAQLQARWQRDQINGLTPVWHAGLASWTPIAELPELKDEFSFVRGSFIV
eukprot:g17279.t1